VVCPGPFGSGDIDGKDQPQSKTTALSGALEAQDHWRAERTDGEAGQVSGALWHHHEKEDEMFLVIKGRFRMEFRDRQVWLEEGEFLIVPKGVEHRPVADEEAHVLLFEPASVLNTGNVTNERTVPTLERI